MTQEYSFIIGDNTYTVRDERELALIFEVLSGDGNISWLIHWNVIMELDENLLFLIKTYKWLLRCLKSLDEKNSFLLLIKIGDILGKVIQDSEQLWEILARIPEEENKIRILKQIRAIWLKKLISGPRDLSNILEWIYNDSQKKFFEIVGHEYIKNLFTYPKEIYSVLHYLGNENKDILIEIIGKENIIAQIKTWKDLLFILKWVPTEQARQILASFSRGDIKNLFLSDVDFIYFLKKLSERKTRVFLQHLNLPYEQ